MLWLVYVCNHSFPQMSFGTETHDKALRSSAWETSPFVRSIQKKTAQLAKYQGMLFSVKPSSRMCESTFWFATVIKSGLICRRTGTLRPRHEGKEARPGHRGNKVKRKAPKVCITCKSIGKYYLQNTEKILSFHCFKWLFCSTRYTLSWFFQGLTGTS